MGGKIQKDEEKLIEILHIKYERYQNKASSGFCNTRQCLRKGREFQDSRHSKRKAIIAVLIIEATTNTIHMNHLQANPSNMTKKNGLHQPKLRKKSNSVGELLFHGQRKPNEIISLFITTLNPNNRNIYSIIKSSVDCLKINIVRGFQNTSLIQSKRQHLNFKRVSN